MQKRRDFLKIGLRGLMLSGLTIMSGILLFREKSEEKGCYLNFTCKSCKKLISCRQPEAIDFKRSRVKPNLRESGK